MFAESEQLKKLVTEFSELCNKSKLKVNVGKSIVTVIRQEYDKIDLGDPYIRRKQTDLSYRIMLHAEIMKKVRAFKYLGTVLCKNGTTKQEIRERIREEGQLEN